MTVYFYVDSEVFEKIPADFIVSHSARSGGYEVGMERRWVRRDDTGKWHPNLFRMNDSVMPLPPDRHERAMKNLMASGLLDENGQVERGLF